MQRTVVVMPCYNEAARLDADALLAATRAWPMLSFVLVDDGSSDGTGDLLRSLQAAAPHAFELVFLAKNRGKAEAVRLGMLAAFASSPVLAGYFDADLATPLAEIEPMTKYFDDARVHLVMGSRVKLLGRNVSRSPLRHYLGRVFASSASVILGLEVYDTQCGAKLFRNTPSMRTLFERPFAVTWTFDVELLARLAALAAQGGVPAPQQSVVEHPLAEWRDVSGSKLRPDAALRAVAELARIRRKYPPSKRG
ncbi:MAG TPA: glycosyltransferase [Polyangiaceae bacterium]|nr:glycosyltransferase [Polyangiaceae bacterium]